MIISVRSVPSSPAPRRPGDEVKVRLVALDGSTGGDEGRVEVYYNGEWGTICQFGFDNLDARVICHMTGFP